MKKELTIGLIVLLSVSLFFVGCESPTNPTPPTPQKTPAELASELAGKLEGLNVTDLSVESSGANVTATLDGNVALNADLAIPSGVTFQVTGAHTLEVDANKKLELAAGATLKVDSDATLKLDSGATADISGQVTVENSSTLDFSGLPDDVVDLTGTITVASGGIFKVKNSTVSNESAISYNNGTLVLEQGSNASLVFSGDPPTEVKMIGSSDAPFTWPTGGSGTSIEFSSDGPKNIITLKGGTLTTNNGASVQAAVIASGAILVVNSAPSFKVNISLEVKGTLQADKPITGIDSATITFGSGATLDGNYVKATNGNFYDADDTKEDAAKSKTYTWDSSAGGGAGGWKRQS
jgi:hypothetical protein